MKKRIPLMAMIGLLIFLFLITACSLDLSENSKVQEDQPQKRFPGLVETIKNQQAAAPGQEQEEPCLLPRVILEGECCLDENNNKLCDKAEVTASCGDGVCSIGENSCTCQQDCGACEAQRAGVCEYNVCENNQCVPKKEASCCGDGVCNTVNEACGTCYQDCCSATQVSSPEKMNLANYPNIAVGLSTVVGDKAPPEDVVVAGDILTHIASEDKAVGKGMLASEVNLVTRDYIVIGNPCHNEAAYDLFRKEIKLNNNNCQIFGPGEGLVKLIPTSPTTVAIYVGGYTPLDTKIAAQQLTDYRKYDPEGIEVKV